RASRDTKYCSGSRSRRFGRGRTALIVFRPSRPSGSPPFTGGCPPFDDPEVDGRHHRGQVLDMTELTERLEQFESRLRSMESDLYELPALAREARATTAAAPIATPFPRPERKPTPEPGFFATAT